MKLLLYSTAHCTLCERALDLLLSMPEFRGLTLEVVDVAESETLLERYAARLPVLAMEGDELDWPFDRADLTQWLAQRAASH